MLPLYQLPYQTTHHSRGERLTQTKPKLRSRRNIGFTRGPVTNENLLRKVITSRSYSSFHNLTLISRSCMVAPHSDLPPIQHSTKALPASSPGGPAYTIAFTLVGPRKLQVGSGPRCLRQRSCSCSRPQQLSPIRRRCARLRGHCNRWCSFQRRCTPRLNRQ